MRRPKKETFGELSDGIPQMPRKMTPREVFVDQLFLYFQIGSKILFLFAGVIGYVWYGGLGCILLSLAGYIVGRLMRRSMGIRGTDPTEGFFIRMRERADGSRRGFLEWFLERLRRTEFTKAKCKAIIDVYNDAMLILRNGQEPMEQHRIIEDMYQKIKEI